MTNSKRTSVSLEQLKSWLARNHHPERTNWGQKVILLRIWKQKVAWNKKKEKKEKTHAFRDLWSRSLVGPLVQEMHSRYASCYISIADRYFRRIYETPPLFVGYDRVSGILAAIYCSFPTHIWAYDKDKNNLFYLIHHDSSSITASTDSKNARTNLCPEASHLTVVTEFPLR